MHTYLRVRALSFLTHNCPNAILYYSSNLLNLFYLKFEYELYSIPVEGEIAVKEDDFFVIHLLFNFYYVILVNMFVFINFIFISFYLF